MASLLEISEVVAAVDDRRREPNEVAKVVDAPLPVEEAVDSILTTATTNRMKISASRRGTSSPEDPRSATRKTPKTPLTGWGSQQSVVYHVLSKK